MKEREREVMKMNLRKRLCFLVTKLVKTMKKESFNINEYPIRTRRINSALSNKVKFFSRHKRDFISVVKIFLLVGN